MSQLLTSHISSPNKVGKTTTALKWWWSWATKNCIFFFCSLFFLLTKKCLKVAILLPLLTTASTVAQERELTNSTLPDLDGLAITLHILDKVKPAPRVILVNLGVSVCSLSDDQVIHALFRILWPLKRNLYEHCGNFKSWSAQLLLVIVGNMK